MLRRWQSRNKRIGGRNSEIAVQATWGFFVPPGHFFSLWIWGIDQANLWTISINPCFGFSTCLSAKTPVFMIKFPNLVRIVENSAR